jgi:hypothetical protein
MRRINNAPPRLRVVTPDGEPKAGARRTSAKFTSDAAGSIDPVPVPVSSAGAAGANGASAGMTGGGCPFCRGRAESDIGSGDRRCGHYIGALEEDDICGDLAWIWENLSRWGRELAQGQAHHRALLRASGLDASENALVASDLAGVLVGLGAKRARDTGRYYHPEGPRVFATLTASLTKLEGALRKLEDNCDDAEVCLVCGAVHLFGQVVHPCQHLMCTFGEAHGPSRSKAEEEWDQVALAYQRIRSLAGPSDALTTMRSICRDAGVSSKLTLLLAKLGRELPEFRRDDDFDIAEWTDEIRPTFLNAIEILTEPHKGETTSVGGSMLSGTRTCWWHPEGTRALLQAEEQLGRLAALMLLKTIRPMSTKLVARRARQPRH